MATKKIGASYDFQKGEIQNAVVQNLASAPGSPAEGQIYYDTVTDDLRYYQGSAAPGGAGFIPVNPKSLWATAGTWTVAQAFNAAVTGNNTLNFTGTGSSAVGGTMGASAFVPAGLTGATAASRYVGATTSGAPASGSFLKGDYVVDQTGVMWICTTAGSPGAWTQVGSTGTVYYQTIKNNAGTGQAQRANLRFNSGTYATASVTDSSPDTIVSFDVAAGATPGAMTFGASASNGSGTTLALANHVHAFPAQNTFALSGFAAPSGDVGWGGFKITNLGTPSASTDAATKAYVDSIAQGLSDFKASVRVVVTTNGTLATAYENGDSAGGVTLATGDRILLAGQTTASENGIYTVNASGAPTRATDADASGEISVGTLVYVEAGTSAGQQWICTATGATPWVPGSSTSTWTMFFTVTATQAGAGLTASANVFAVGQGTGITVNADDVAIDTSVVVRKYTTATHSSSTSIVITHNLNNQWVQAQVVEVATGDIVDCAVDMTSANTTTFDFNVAPGANTMRFIIQG